MSRSLQSWARGIFIRRVTAVFFRSFLHAVSCHASSFFKLIRKNVRLIYVCFIAEHAPPTPTLPIGQPHLPFPPHGGQPLLLLLVNLTPPPLVAIQRLMFSVKPRKTVWPIKRFWLESLWVLKKVFNSDATSSHPHGITADFLYRNLTYRRIELVHGLRRGGYNYISDNLWWETRERWLETRVSYYKFWFAGGFQTFCIK